MHFVAEEPGNKEIGGPQRIHMKLSNAYYWLLYTIKYNCVSSCIFISSVNMSAVAMIWSCISNIIISFSTVREVGQAHTHSCKM